MSVEARVIIKVVKKMQKQTSVIVRQSSERTRTIQETKEQMTMKTTTGSSLSGVMRVTQHTHQRQVTKSERDENGKCHLSKRRLPSLSGNKLVGLH